MEKIVLTFGKFDDSYIYGLISVNDQLFMLK